MDRSNIIKKVSTFSWAPWIRRPFSPFVRSFFKEGITSEAFSKIGFRGLECEAFVYQEGDWYESKQVWEKMLLQFDDLLDRRSVLDVVDEFDIFAKAKKKYIKELCKENNPPLEDLKRIYDIMTIATCYIWLTHGFEEYYDKKLKIEVPKYIKKDVETFISEASYPTRKNRSMLFEEMLRKEKDSQKIVDEFAWIKSRDDLTEPLNVEEVEEMMAGIKAVEKHVPKKIPKQLQTLFAEVRALVFFRTERKDVFSELLFLARPIFERVAESHKISLEELRFCIIDDLMEGKLKFYNKNYSCVCYKGNIIFSNEVILNFDVIEQDSTIKGTIAQKGIVTGKVKIINDISELGKVKEGDVLVASMTFPSYIAAMNRAVAFVTDEGGITCHAAIIAREMKKPCVIGTKVATKVLRDGDMVEIDADKGTVKKI